MSHTHPPLRRPQRSRLALALEPRMMFDAAAVTTATMVASQAETDAARPSIQAQAVEAGTHSVSTSDLQTLSSSDNAELLRTSNATASTQDPSQAPSLGADARHVEYGDVVTGESLLNMEAGNGFGFKAVATSGDQVYVVRSTIDTVLVSNEPYEDRKEEVATLFVLQRGTDGKLEQRQSLDQSDVPDLIKAQTLHLSGDGSLLYVSTEAGKTVLFSRDPTDGRLAVAGTLDTEKLGIPSDVRAHGDFVYVSTADKITVYNRDGSVVTGGTVEPAAGAVYGTMQISADGQLLYSGLLGSDQLVSVFRIGAGGALTHVHDFAGSDSATSYNAASMTLSPDGRALYVTEKLMAESGSDTDPQDAGVRLHIFAAQANGSLESLGVQNLQHTPISIAVSPDGDLIAILRAGEFISSAIDVYGRSTDGKLALLSTTSGFGEDEYDPDYKTIRDPKNATFSPDGTQLYIVGTVRDSGQNNEGVLVINLSAERSTFTEGATAVALLPGGTLADPQLDALANGGDYQGASLTVIREGAQVAGDQYTFLDGNGFVLRDSKLLRGSAEVASFTVANNMLTVGFSATVSQAEAQTILRQIAYRHDGNDPTKLGSTADFKITLHDGSGQQDELIAKLGLVGINQPLTLAATPVDSTYVVGGNAVSLFDSVTVDTIEANQLIARVEIKVRGASEGDRLVLDGTEIALDEPIGWPVFTANSRIEYRVVRENDGMLVRFYSGDASLSVVGAWIESAAFKHVGDQTSGSRSVSLTVFEEFIDGKMEKAELASQATVTIAAEPPQAPTLGAEVGGLEFLERLIDQNGPSAYQNINGITSVGEHVYAVRSMSNDNGTAHTLHVFQRGEDGKLSLKDSIEGTETNGLAGAQNVGISSDGRTLYVTTLDTANNLQHLALFTRDPATGLLTELGTLPTDVAFDTIHAVVATNDRLYVSADHILAGNVLVSNQITLFTRNGDSWASVRTPAESTGFTTLQLSADGQLLFAGNTGSNTLATVFQVESDGRLIEVDRVTSSASNGATSRLALSPDGRTLHIVNDSSLFSVDVASDGTLSLTGSPIALGDQPLQLLTSADHAAVLVVYSNRVALYARQADGSLGAAPSLYSEFPNLFSLAATSASLSADGRQLYMSGEFNFAPGLLTLNLIAAQTNYTEGQSATILQPQATLADPQLDALGNGSGNYNGASLTIERQGGINPSDVFGFQNGTSFTLDSANGQIKRGNDALATFATSAGKLTLTFTASISRADAQSIVRGITYSNNSNDPGERVRLRMELNDGENHSSIRTVDVNIITVNDQPIVSVIGLRPTFNAEGERQRLFENPEIDVVEKASQEVWQVILTIDAPIGSGDVIDLRNGDDGGRVVLDAPTSGAPIIANGLEYQVNDNGNSTEVIFFVNRNVEQAVEFINSLTYGNTGNASSGTRTITLSIRDNGGGDNNMDVGIAADAAVVTLAAATSPNTAPEFNSDAATINYLEQAVPVLIASNATVNDSQMDAFNGGAGNYDGAVLTVTLGAGKSAADSLGFNAGNGLTLNGNNLQKGTNTIGSVSRADGVMTIRFSDATGTIPTTLDVNNTLKQITYANSSDVPTASVVANITLADQRGLMSEPLALTIEIETDNDAPSIGQDPVLSLKALARLQQLTDVTAPTAGVASSDGRFVYVANDSAIAVFRRDPASGQLTYVDRIGSEGGASRMKLSPDGKQLYVLSTSGSDVVRLKIDADGNLMQQQRISYDFAVHGSEGLISMRDLTISADGKHFYLIGPYGYSRFDVAPTDGNLTWNGYTEGSMQDAPFLWEPTEIASYGDRVYIVTDSTAGSSLIVYQHDSNGKLEYQTDFQFSGEDLPEQGVHHIALSADGRTVFLGNSSLNKVEVFTLSADSHTLTRNSPPIEVGSGMRDIAVSADGSALFVTLDDGSLEYYSAITGDKLPSSQSGITNAASIVALDDGSVIVIGDTVSVISATPAKMPPLVIGGDPIRVATTLQVNDPEANAANNYSGAQLTFSSSSANGTFGFTHTDTFTRVGNDIQRGGATVATLSNGVLAFTASTVTRDDANALLRQINYQESASAQPGERTLTITLNDGELDSAPHSFTLVAELANREPVDSGETLQPGTAQVGQAYRHTLPATLFTDADNDTLTWSVTGLPAGLSFDAPTRTISGTPTTAGTASLTVSVSDGRDGTSSRSWTLEVAAAPVTPEPPITQPPVVTPEPPVTQPPVVTPEPPITQPPVVTPEPPVTQPPVVTPEPPVTQPPVVTPEPPVTQPPVITPEPPVTQPPVVTPEPPVTQPPVVTPEPPVTQPPVVTLPTPLVSQSAFGLVRETTLQELDEQSEAPSATAASPSAGANVQRTASYTVNATADADNAQAQDTIDQTWQTLTPTDPRGAELADGTRSPLVALTDGLRADGSARGPVSGSWVSDLDGNRQLFVLPPGLFATSSPVEGLTLRSADGRPLPASLRLDTVNGRIVASGMLTARDVRLELVLRTADGRESVVPVHITATADQAARTVPNASDQNDASAAAHKPALSDALRQEAASDLLAQARDLLAQLIGDTTPAPTTTLAAADAVPDTAVQQ